MENPRFYGNRPFGVAVLHGGPGAPGYMAPVARELSSDRGVLEPLQTADSLEGQVEELREILVQHADLPVTLIGSSCGALLGFIFSARHSQLVKKLILVGSGVYDERYAAGILPTRMSRLTDHERREACALMESLENPAITDKSSLLARLGAIWTKTDAYDPFTLDQEILEYQYALHCRVWEEAAQLRRGGGLLELGHHIQCPVVAIHGDYDPHPSRGVHEPLSAVVKAFRFVPLSHCGHLPWLERQARAAFYDVLREELL